MSRDYDLDLDPTSMELICEVVSKTDKRYEIRAFTLGGYPLFFASIGGVVCNHGNGMYVWVTLEEAIEQVRKWR